MTTRALVSITTLLVSVQPLGCGSSGGDDGSASSNPGAGGSTQASAGKGGAGHESGGASGGTSHGGAGAQGVGGASGKAGASGVGGEATAGGMSGAAGNGGASGASAMGGSMAASGSSGSGGSSGVAGLGGGTGLGGSAGASGASGGGIGGTSSQGGMGGGAGAPTGGNAGSGGAACTGDMDCTSSSLPKCDTVSGACVACLVSSDPVPPTVCSLGVCALVPPTCTNDAWVCDGPGYQPVETKCDGYDNDCNGIIDDGCPPCTVSLTDLQANLASIWDIDFDFQCNTYLTTVISGPDYTRVVHADGTSPTTYFGNANQNMGFALVDPDPGNQRVMVLYSCQNSSCLATNGITLLYTCAPTDPGCGCSGQTNCPGFLDTPFLTATAHKGSITNNGFEIGAPNGLTVGPGNKYYVGNWQPLACDADSSTCVPCDPMHLTVSCGESDACCDTTPIGRLAAFTLPQTGVDPTVRVEAIYPGEEIYGLSTGRDGYVYVGTYVSATAGNLYRYDPYNGASDLVQSFGGAVFSITEEPTSKELYLELRASPKIVRLSPAGTVLALPATVPSDPAGDGVLQIGPDHRLYRLQGAVDSEATLDAFDLP